jgi:hypothetical protein
VNTAATLRLRGSHAPITIEVFWPRPERGDQPLIVTLGGDGATLSERHRRIVLSVQADGIDDAWAALRWAANHAAELGARPGCVALAVDRAHASRVRQLAALARTDGWPLLQTLDSEERRA